MKEITLRASDGRDYQAAIVDRTEKLGHGQEGTVGRVTIAAEHPRGVEIGQLAEKIFHETKGDKKRDPQENFKAKQKIERILRMHHDLQQKGYPTVPKMLTNEETNRLYLTDLTLNGEREVVSAAEIGDGKDREPVSIQNAEGLSLQLASIFKKSVADCLSIDKKDVFFLVLDKDKQEAEILLADLSKLEFKNGGSDLPSIIAKQNFSIIEKLVRIFNRALSPETQLTLEYVENEMSQVDAIKL